MVVSDPVRNIGSVRQGLSGRSRSVHRAASFQVSRIMCRPAIRHNTTSNNSSSNRNSNNSSRRGRRYHGDDSTNPTIAGSTRHRDRSNGRQQQQQQQQDRRRRNSFPRRFQRRRRSQRQERKQREGREEEDADAGRDELTVNAIATTTDYISILSSATINRSGDDDDASTAASIGDDDYSSSSSSSTASPKLVLSPSLPVSLFSFDNIMDEVERKSFGDNYNKEVDASFVLSKDDADNDQPKNEMIGNDASSNHPLGGKTMINYQQNTRRRSSYGYGTDENSDNSCSSGDDNASDIDNDDSTTRTYKASNRIRSIDANNDEEDYYYDKAEDDEIAIVEKQINCLLGQACELKMKYDQLQSQAIQKVYHHPFMTVDNNADGIVITNTADCHSEDKISAAIPPRTFTGTVRGAVERINAATAPPRIELLQKSLADYNSSQVTHARIDTAAETQNRWLHKELVDASVLNQSLQMQLDDCARDRKRIQDIFKSHQEQDQKKAELISALSEKLAKSENTIIASNDSTNDNTSDGGKSDGIVSPESESALVVVAEIIAPEATDQDDNHDKIASLSSSSIPSTQDDTLDTENNGNYSTNDSDSDGGKSDGIVSPELESALVVVAGVISHKTTDQDDDHNKIVSLSSSTKSSTQDDKSDTSNGNNSDGMVSPESESESALVAVAGVISPKATDQDDDHDHDEIASLLSSSTPSTRDDKSDTENNEEEQQQKLFNDDKISQSSQQEGEGEGNKKGKEEEPREQQQQGDESLVLSQSSSVSSSVCATETAEAMRVIENLLINNTDGTTYISSPSSSWSSSLAVPSLHILSKEETSVNKTGTARLPSSRLPSIVVKENSISFITTVHEKKHNSEPTAGFEDNNHDDDRDWVGNNDDEAIVKLVDNSFNNNCAADGNGDDDDETDIETNVQKLMSESLTSSSSPSKGWQEEQNKELIESLRAEIEILRKSCQEQKDLIDTNMEFSKVWQEEQTNKLVESLRSEIEVLRKSCQEQKDLISMHSKGVSMVQDKDVSNLTSESLKVSASPSKCQQEEEQTNELIELLRTEIKVLRQQSCSHEQKKALIATINNEGHNRELQSHSISKDTNIETIRLKRERKDLLRRLERYTHMHVEMKSYVESLSVQCEMRQHENRSLKKRIGKYESALKEINNKVERGEEKRMRHVIQNQEERSYRRRALNIQLTLSEDSKNNGKQQPPLHATSDKEKGSQLQSQKRGVSLELRKARNKEEKMTTLNIVEKEQVLSWQGMKGVEDDEHQQWLSRQQAKERRQKRDNINYLQGQILEQHTIRKTYNTTLTKNKIDNNKPSDKCCELDGIDEQRDDDDDTNGCGKEELLDVIDKHNNSKIQQHNSSTTDRSRSYNDSSYNKNDSEHKPTVKKVTTTSTTSSSFAPKTSFVFPQTPKTKPTINTRAQIITLKPPRQPSPNQYRLRRPKLKSQLIEL